MKGAYVTREKLTLIKGGLALPYESDKKSFISAYVTNTRLMGVVGMYIHWRAGTGKNPLDFHQFFYFDVEELGFESYKSVTGNDIMELRQLEQTLMGGLGGDKISISQREATGIIQTYAEINNRLSLPFPPGKKEYAFLLNGKIDMSDREKRDLLKLQCVEINSDYLAINYFLMRIFAKDHEAAGFLTKNAFPLDVYADIPIATLHMNTIDYFEGETGSSYLCESLIEHDTSYMLIISEITVKNYRVASFEKRSVMHISAAEAAMMLSRPEFVTVYEILSPPEDFDDELSGLALDAILSIHENGKLFLSFNKSNDHVNNRVFRLNEDVSGLYFITDYGQMIIAAYSVKKIRAIEKDLRKSTLAKMLLPVSKYEFKEPVLYEFIQSDFDDFEDFIDFIKK